MYIYISMTFQKGMYSNSTWTVVNKLYIVKLKTGCHYLIMRRLILQQMLRVRLQRLHATRTLKYLLHTSVWPSLAEVANDPGGKFDEEGQQGLKRRRPVLCRIPSQHFLWMLCVSISELLLNSLLKLIFNSQAQPKVFHLKPALKSDTTPRNFLPAWNGRVRSG